ncbi:MAG TPA: biotin/lipoyl-containing protein [Candidatus Kapabacteria bacterium]
MKQQIEVNGEKVEIEGGIPPISINNRNSYLVNTGSGTHEVFVLPDGRISDGNSIDGIAVEVSSGRDALIARYFSKIGSNGNPVAGKAHLVIKAPMPGLVKSIFVKVGDEVVKTTQVLILEAMKMENSIQSPGTGIVASIKTEIGKNVEKNQILVELKQ